MFKTHYRLERYSIGLVVAIIVVASIGGIVEIAPLFTIHETVEKAPDMRVYTPLELAGRTLNVREGCYAFHPQQIRTLRDAQGSAACRDRVHQYGETTVGAVS